MHTRCRSVLGQINWLQSRTQPHICYFFPRCASAAAAPTIGDVRKLNKLVRTIKATPVELKFWPLQGNLRILGFPDASYRNNEDKSSQRAHCIFIAQEKKEHQKNRGRPGDSAYADTSGSLVDYESHKITSTTMSTTVAELHALMRCFGSFVCFLEDFGPILLEKFVTSILELMRIILLPLLPPHTFQNRKRPFILFKCFGRKPILVKCMILLMSVAHIA